MTLFRRRTAVICCSIVILGSIFSPLLSNRGERRVFDRTEPPPSQAGYTEGSNSEGGQRFRDEVSNNSKSPNSVPGQNLELRSQQPVRFRVSVMRPIVPVKINDQGPFWFVLDTGANGISISPSLSKRLGIPEGNQGWSQTAGAQAYPFRYGAVKSIQFGGARVSDSWVAIHEMTQNADYDGVLGMGFLRNFMFSIDFRAQQIDIPSESGPSKNGIDRARAISFRFDSATNKTPVIEVRVNGRGPYVFLVDTGASTTVLSPKVARDIGIRTTSLADAKLAGGITVAVPVGTVDVLEFGPELRVKDVAVGVLDMPNGAGYVGVLGAPILSEFRMTIDALQFKITFESPKE
jgi:predicted aspartyl protease